MRILAISDIHGNRTALRAVLAAAAPADVIVLAGDLTHLGGPDDAADAVALCRAHSPLVLTVTGNCDDELIEKQMARDGNSLTGTGRIVNGVGFFGASAANPHLGNSWEVSEETLARWMDEGHRVVSNARRKVLVAHQPPFGFADCTFRKTHGGSHAVRAALDQYAPVLVVCGHIHEARGMAHYNGPSTHALLPAGQARSGCTIVNCGPSWMGFYAEVELGAEAQVEMKQLPHMDW